MYFRFVKKTTITILYYPDVPNLTTKHFLKHENSVVRIKILCPSYDSRICNRKKNC